MSSWDDKLQTPGYLRDHFYTSLSFRAAETRYMSLS